MITIKQGMKISLIVDKLGLKITDPTKTQEQVGADLMMQILTKAHKAKQEIYDFVADIKKITPEEASEVDLIEFIKDLMSDAGVLDFFKSAVKSKVQG